MPSVLDHARALRRRQTEAENRLWFHLRDRRLGGFKFRRQHPLGRYIADFVCLEARIIVEADGGQHQWQAAHDEERDTYLAAQGYVVLRFWNDAILARTDDVLSEILRQLHARPLTRR